MRKHNCSLSSGSHGFHRPGARILLADLLRPHEQVVRVHAGWQWIHGADPIHISNLARMRRLA